MNARKKLAAGKVSSFAPSGATSRGARLQSNGNGRNRQGSGGIREALDRAASLACLREQAHALLLRRNALREDLTQVLALIILRRHIHHTMVAKKVSLM